MTSFQPLAIVLLSGGLDSATTLAVARSRGFRTAALTIQYGQRHNVEIEAAKHVTRAFGVVEHRFVSVDLRAFGGSALTDEIAVPKSVAGAPPREGIPATYVPARNTIFLSLALAHAEVLGAADIFIGVNALDYSGYPDCRPKFIAAFQELAQVATRTSVGGQSVKIHAPLIDLTKAQIIQLGMALGVDYALTHSCYDPTPSGMACGCCDSCHIRRTGFESAGVPDPTLYGK